VRLTLCANEHVEQQLGASMIAVSSASAKVP